MIIGGWRDPGWRVVDTDSRPGSQIRTWISSAISGHDCPVDVADAALVVSELFANACLYGQAGGQVLVGYCLWRKGARLVVCDGGGPGAPQLVEGDELAEGGRGLQVVDSLAARWGSFRLAGARVVWSDFGQPLHAPPSDVWAWLRLVLSVCDLSPPGRSRAAAMPGHLAAAGGPMMVRQWAKRAVIAEALRAGVADGTYAPGSKLPRQDEFAAEFGSSVTPVGHAFGEVEADGLIRRVLDGRGNGFFVTTAQERWETNNILVPVTRMPGTGARLYDRAEVMALLEKCSDQAR